MNEIKNLKLTQVIERVCHLPKDFRTFQTESFVTLLNESGYPDVYDQIDTVMISRYLRSHPQLIEDWHTYSADKRTPSNWYLLDHLVGYLEKDGSRTKERNYEDMADACAAFIVNELMGMIRS